ncbi:hypothetical protein CONPUDRAFT_106629 [Coniophora puteana RWD-64-598 SS2]|uniref:Zn(2)-C6 fungal-type domain-containing protein n=1 Tax=Coniophora puteana (strain RWD-64-598) TaxID=741705 RepID=A0A5M3ML82_CONPW|nr:uncharacterized protein CONPUDRAFT_106629 [Coniophora puteana RWD-64-598 SS2]EIW79928.1 hypothetical protein CONPUDRAFT_106629 [Coniophora puteana RWD-64-598 SS2]
MPRRSITFYEFTVPSASIGVIFKAHPVLNFYLYCLQGGSSLCLTLHSTMSNKERKRTRGEIACAECRRLKARCDKQIPCSTCIKRGCSMLCPNGTMPPGEGSRFVGIAEDYLRRKTAKLEERMRSLEDALAIIQGNTTSEPHPLLQQRLSPDPLDPEERPSSRGESDEYNKYGLIGALGQLHFEGDNQSGHSRFFGASGGSETLLLQAKEFMIESGSESPPILREADLSYLPREILMFSQSFPFTPMGIPIGPVQTMIESQLPSIERARDLCGIYLTSMSWMAHIVSMQHMHREVIPAVYKLPGSSNISEYGPHELALLLIVMAIGALCDPNLPPYNSEAQHYHCLARAAICLQPILGERSLTTVKALHLKSIYNGMSGKESNLEKCYALLNLSGQTALQIGFHKDPERWGFTGREAYDRRAYFWNLFAGTLWQSLVTGRPPVIMPSVVDCRPPTIEEEMLFQRNEIPLGFGSWSFSYTSECLVPVVEATQAVKAPPYQSIQELDHRIRQFAIPQVGNGIGDEQVAKEMQNFARSHYRELTLMFLHRGFFAQAMTDYPSDPQRSPVVQSFIAAYQSACSVLASTIVTFSQNPTLLARIWRPWSFAFSAAVIIGTVAIRALSVEPEPFEELEKACQLFRKASQHNCSRAHKALPVLLQLRQKAVQAREDRLGPTARRPEGYDEEGRR